MGILFQRERRGVAALLAAVLLCVGLAGCGRRLTSLPDLCDGAFCAELVWEKEGILLRGQLTVSETDEAGTRDLTLTLLAPAELRGICARRTEGAWGLELEDMLFDGLPIPGLLEVAELLLATEGLRYVCDTERNGERLRLAESQWQGKRVERYLTVPDGIPRELVCEELRIRILKFQRT